MGKKREVRGKEVSSSSCVTPALAAVRGITWTAACVRQSWSISFANALQHAWIRGRFRLNVVPCIMGLEWVLGVGRFCQGSPPQKGVRVKDTALSCAWGVEVLGRKGKKIATFGETMSLFYFN